jgi:hypothetical protein
MASVAKCGPVLYDALYVHDLPAEKEEAREDTWFSGAQ